MTDQHDAGVEQTTSLSPFWCLLLGLFIGLIIGGAAVGYASAEPFNTAEEEPATVSCVTYTTESGNASGMCFVSGDVRFRWLNADQNTTNGTVELEGLPVENSSVRREK